jgi:hypothetical protein
MENLTREYLEEIVMANTEYTYVGDLDLIELMDLAGW